MKSLFRSFQSSFEKVQCFQMSKVYFSFLNQLNILRTKCLSRVPSGFLFYYLSARGIFIFYKQRVYAGATN